MDEPRSAAACRRPWIAGACSRLFARKPALAASRGAPRRQQAAALEGLHRHALQAGNDIMRAMRTLALLTTLLAVTLQADPNTYAIKAARLIDGTGAPPLTNAVVIVTGNTIKAVGSNVAVPAGAATIDLGDATILPGFIDAHTHMIGREL